MAPIVNPDWQLRRLTMACSAGLLLATLASPAGLLGCSAFDHDVAESGRQHAAEVAATIENPAAPTSADFSVLQVDADRPFTGLAVLEPPTPEIPTQWTAADAISLSLAGTLGDQLMASLIESATGVAVRFVGLRPEEAPDDPFGLPATALPEGGIWTGPLDELLDTWTATRGYFWRWRPDSEYIEVVRSQAVVFTLNALAGTQTISGTTSTTETTGQRGSPNRARQSMAASASYDPWTEVTEQLTAVLDSSASISAAPSTASLTVRGLPRDVDRARNYLAWLNRTILRPVTVSFSIYRVAYDSGADYELGIGGAIERVLGTSAGVQVLSDEISIVLPGPGIDSLAAALTAMETAGTVFRELTATVPSLNAQPEGSGR